MPIKDPISAMDRFSQKWPRPKTLRSAPSQACSPHDRLGAWSEGENKAALVEGTGLGMNSEGQWTPHKRCLLMSITSVFAYGLSGMVCALLTCFDGAQHASFIAFASSPRANRALLAYPAAPVLLISDSSVPILLTIYACLLLLSSITGIAGTLLHSRSILAVYALFLFPCLIAMASIGYVSYRKKHFSLDRKLNEDWNVWYVPGARTVIQNGLQCCGWTSAAHVSVFSRTCYARKLLPGCHSP
ncbi:hypothetical protein EWM64_g3310 [Hericium alpestre]|uniref:Uncharacterized protein n=1 Tax=Hericium alpestre TaxID=135208 RepID=A0A4Z0A2M7_9AGAM|nr:hypothetical protein EWM64_g3310 [Hericium alpestre]